MSVSTSFQRTRWSQIRLAASADAPGSSKALEAFCKHYRPAIQTYILGHLKKFQRPLHLAEDWSQDFIIWLIQPEQLKKAVERNEQRSVTMRAFVFEALHYFLIDRYRREKAARRGGGNVLAASDVDEAEWLAAQPVTQTEVYAEAQRQWLRTLLEASLQDLHQQYVSENKEDIFHALRPFISADNEEGYEAISRRLGHPVNTLKSYTHRLRGYWQQHVRAHIAETLNDDSDEAINAELADLQGFR